MTSLISLALLLSLPANISAQAVGDVCHHPNIKCTTSHKFEPHQLPFKINEALVFGKTYRSQPFYAVILKSVKADGNSDCPAISESERLAAQLIWPTRKVFASRYSCPEELVLYLNTDQSFNFLAVYAGRTMSEARQVLKRARATGNFSQAYLKRMRVVLEYST